MVNFLLYKAGEFIALNLPLKISYWVAVVISDIRYLFAAKDRLGVKENLKAIFPDKSERELKRIRIRVFRNFAKYLVDFFRLTKLNKEYIKNNIKIENIHYLDEAMSHGKGAIALTAHLGNWELGGVVIALLGYPFWAVALPHKDKRVDDFFNFQRASKGMNVIPLGKSSRACLEILKENKVLALAGDRNFNEKGAAVDFFGKLTFLPKGPATFSLKTGAAIVPGFMLRNADDSFTLRFEKPIYNNVLVHENKKEELEKMIIRCKTAIEEYIRRYPDQWYVFRRFWEMNG
jgi:lauroyl/myristoyl acyltransferase